MTPQEFKQALIEMREDDEHLNENVLGQVLQYMPSQSELKKLQSDAEKIPIEEIHQAERFAIVLGSIKGIDKRIKAMLFKIKFAESVQEVKKDIVNITAACDETRHSGKFAEVLKVILGIGNYMNAGSSNGRAIGFEIKNLLNLASTKTVDNKSNLLQFLVKILEEKYPSCLDFYEDFIHLDQATKGMF